VRAFQCRCATRAAKLELGCGSDLKDNEIESALGRLDWVISQGSSCHESVLQRHAAFIRDRRCTRERPCITMHRFSDIWRAFPFI